MSSSRLRRILSRSLLTIAYLAVALQWLWILALGLPVLIETGLLDTLTPSQQVEPPTQPTVASEPSPILSIVAGIVTLLFLMLTIFILVKLPKTISTTGDKVIRQTTQAVVPVITHHKKISEKKKRLLSRRIAIIIQICLVLTPLVASFFIPPVQTITSQIITTLAIWLAGISTVCFAISWLLEPKTTSRTRSHASRG